MLVARAVRQVFSRSFIFLAGQVYNEKTNGVRNR